MSKANRLTVPFRRLKDSEKREIVVLNTDYIIVAQPIIYDAILLVGDAEFTSYKSNYIA